MLHNTDSISSRVYLEKVWVYVYSSSQFLFVRACVRVFPFFVFLCFVLNFNNFIFNTIRTQLLQFRFQKYGLENSTMLKPGFLGVAKRFPKSIMRPYASLSTQCQYLYHAAHAPLRLPSQIPPSCLLPNLWASFLACDLMACVSNRYRRFMNVGFARM